MAVEVRLPTLLRPHADGASSVAADGATVGEVFGALDRAVPRASQGQLVDDAGGLHKFVNVYVQRRRHPVPRPARHQGRPTATCISILPAVAGG